MNSIFTNLKGLIKPMDKKTSMKLAFIFAGLVSTVWFLIRVIPKPQRAMYPCMRAAAPIMSSFVIWTLSVLGMMFAFRKAKSSFANSKFMFSAMFAVAFFISAVIFINQGGAKVFANLGSSREVLAPIGTPKGIFPGRVAWVYNKDAAKWTGAGNFWASGVNNQTEYNAAFTQGIRIVSGGTDDASSWDKMFKWFNNSHGRTGTGYVAGDKIAIKINQNNSAYSGAGGSGMNANPYACVAIVASLVNAGVPQADIWIGDPSRAVTDNIFNAIHTVYPDVNVMDYFGNNGRKKSAYTAGAFTNGSGIYTSLATCFVQARYLVSLPILKGHPGQNFSFGAKNWFGSHNMSNDWAKNTHPGGNDWEYEYMKSSAVGGKVILWCMDASYPSVNLDGVPSTNKGANFIMSLDGCAEESVSLDMWRSYYGTSATGENYIHMAATAGAGVHDHWDANKKYYNGIDLVYKAKPWDEGPVVTITQPTNGSSVMKGDVVSIKGTAVAETGQTITKVEVTAGGTPLTVTGTTSWSCSYPANTAGSVAISAVATSSAAKTGSANASITVKTPPVPTPIPGRIQVENYTDMLGIQVEATTDPEGGVSNIGYTDAGDWFEFYVSVAAQTTFKTNFRVASLVSTGSIELREGTTVLTALTLQTTGGWQVWATKPGTTTFTLPAGNHTLRVHYLGSGMNINWIDFITNDPQVLTKIIVSPATKSVVSGSTTDFNAVGYDQNNVVMPITETWSVSGGGTINSSGLFTANAVGTSFVVKASVGSIFGTALVDVTAPSTLSRIELTSATATIIKGSCIGLTAVGYDQNNSVIAFTPTWSVSGGGTIVNGVFCATATGTSVVTVSSGAISNTDTIKVTEPEGLVIPGKIEAEAYTNMFGITKNTCSDIGGGEAIGDIAANDYADYNVIVAAAGTYNVAIRVASFKTTGLASFQIKSGTTVLTTVTVPNTGGWTTWQTINTTVTLAAGAQTLTIFDVVSGVNINWFDFTAVSSIKIEAEAYTNMFGVTTTATTDIGGGQHIGDIAANDWAEYSINAPVAGTYNVAIRVASFKTTGLASFQIKKGTTILATVTVPNTGGWTTWQTINTSVTLTAGVQTLTIFDIVSGVNINWFEFVQTGLKSVTSIETAVNEIVNTYPNPTAEILNIEFGNNSPSNLVQIYSLNGSLVLSQNVNGSFATVNVSKLSKGNYVLKVNNNRKMITKN
jgi:hypothetical protein